MVLTNRKFVLVRKLSGGLLHLEECNIEGMGDSYKSCLVAVPNILAQGVSLVIRQKDDVSLRDATCNSSIATLSP